MEENFSIKTFVRRNAHSSPRQKTLYAELSPQYCIPFDQTILDFSAVFGNTHKTIIEIGFGSGDATSKIALANPGTNYLCLEVFRTGVAKLLAKIADNGIQNIRIIEHDAVEVLCSMIADGSVAGFHIFFPDPWPKKRHHKRRLLQVDKIRILTQKLMQGGYIYFVTDWADYAESAKHELESVAELENRFEGFAPKQEWRPQTNFERKALSAGRSIFELIFERAVFEKREANGEAGI